MQISHSSIVLLSAFSSSPSDLPRVLYAGYGGMDENVRKSVWIIHGRPALHGGIRPRPDSAGFRERGQRLPGQTSHPT